MKQAHRKSRTGCTQCKRRRVKCDEKKPTCTSCERNSLPCSLEFLTPRNSSARGKLVASHSLAIFQTSNRELYPFSPTLSKQLSNLSFDDQTRELLHHYTTVLSSLFVGNREPTVWRVSMLQIGLEYPFLFSGILAISALHLATLHPHRKQELQHFAVAQESAALPSFRATIKNLNAESIHAAFAFAGSVVYYIMALPESQDSRKIDRCRIPTRVDKYPHWFQTIRGLMALLSNYCNELSSGPFAPLFNAEPVPEYIPDNPDHKHLAKLDGMFSSLPPTPLLSAPPSNPCSSPGPLLFPDVRKEEFCKEALDELRGILTLTCPPYHKIYSEASLRIWPGHISQDFMELIYERDPRALVILAHYCVFLKKNDHVWYVRGLGQGLLENIWEALGEEWRPWIRWAMEQPVCRIPVLIVPTEERNLSLNRPILTQQTNR